jgi:hypothetical protein
MLRTSTQLRSASRTTLMRRSAVYPRGNALLDTNPLGEPPVEHPERLGYLLALLKAELSSNDEK